MQYFFRDKIARCGVLIALGWLILRRDLGTNAWSTPPSRSVRSREVVCWNFSPASSASNDLGQETKTKLLDSLSSVPRNMSTDEAITAEILSTVRKLEDFCPTAEQDVLKSLGGNWELIWTAQDRSATGSKKKILNWINPLENQSYSNNPNGASSGQSNPILPQNIQSRLEKLGIITNEEEIDSNENMDKSVRSSQAIDLKNKKVRNVVNFQTNYPLPRLRLNPFPFLKSTTTQDGIRPKASGIRGFLTVDVNFEPSKDDARRVDVKFDACRLSVEDSPFPIPVDIKFPLGVVGPTGWLRTGYIDDDIRITRGHKGSVFILSRTSKSKKDSKRLS